MDLMLLVLWWSMIGGTIVLFLACALAPGLLVRWQSMPWAFHLSRNLDVNLQGVIYAAYHRHWVSRLSHATIPIEQVAWGVVLILGAASTVGAMGAGVVLFCVGVQVWHIGSLRQALFLTVMWGVTLGLSVLWCALDGGAMAHAQWALLGLSLQRTVSHAVEPLPPGIANPTDAFVSLRGARLPLWQVGALGVIGWVSEFASALPFRLFVVQVAWLGERTGAAPGFRWASAVASAEAIHTRGWRAHSELNRLFASVARPVVEPPAVAARPVSLRARLLVRRRTSLRPPTFEASRGAEARRIHT